MLGCHVGWFYLAFGDGGRINNTALAVPGPLNHAGHRFPAWVLAEERLVAGMETHPSDGADPVRRIQRGHDSVCVKRAGFFNGIGQRVDRIIGGGRAVTRGRSPSTLRVSFSRTPLR